MIRIVQCLCPSRHAIMAYVYDDAEVTPERARYALAETLTAAIIEGPLNPWCGLCNSRSFHYEDAVTPFRTMEEALPHFERLERENQHARAVLGGANRN